MSSRGETPAYDAIAAAPTRVVVAVDAESLGIVTGRTSAVAAAGLGQEVTVLPGGHSGLLGGEFGQQGTPEEFAAKLREVLGSA